MLLANRFRCDRIEFSFSIVILRNQLLVYCPYYVRITQSFLPRQSSTYPVVSSMLLIVALALIH